MEELSTVHRTARQRLKPHARSGIYGGAETPPYKAFTANHLRGNTGMRENEE
jgi:hypothetical protein